MNLNEERERGFLGSASGMPNEAVAWLSCASLLWGGNGVCEVGRNWLEMMHHATYGAPSKKGSS